MLKLMDYLKSNCSEINFEDQIYFDKFENLFKSIANNDSVYFYNPSCKNTKKDILSIFEIIKHKNKKCLLLMINGDVDIPCIKEYWFDRDNIPYSDSLQADIEKNPLEFFLEMDLLNYIPKNCLIYCNSVIKKHKNLNMIPLGRDFKGKDIAKNFVVSENKKHLCYYNCSLPPKSIHWYGRIREYIYNNVKNKNYIICENMCLNFQRNINGLQFEKYYNNIVSSKFMLCPRGCGLDTYRMWDCLYLGCIPIVVKYDGYDDFNDMPILFVDKWEDYLNLTEDYLTNKWEEMVEKSYNYDKLKFSWWENKIRKELV